MVKNSLVVLFILFLCGCASIPPQEELTPQKKLEKYGCVYFPDENGFCCENIVPEKDYYILNCKYADTVMIENY